MPAHQWHLSFDRVICRACGVRFSDGDGSQCKGAAKIRPMATAVRDVVFVAKIADVARGATPRQIDGLAFIRDLSERKSYRRIRGL